jgi:hypothetical protein
MTEVQADWSDIIVGDFTDPEKFRQRLNAGADPLGELWTFDTPLHVAAQEGSPQVVFELASRARDLDAFCQGRSALWNAVYHRRDDNALVLAELGADPWRPMMDGWSPGRLSLAGSRDLFEVPRDQALTDQERAMADAGRELAEVFSGFAYGLTGRAVWRRSVERSFKGAPVIPRPVPFDLHNQPAPPPTIRGEGSKTEGRLSHPIDYSQ